jgi:hypothetical protein
MMIKRREADEGMIKLMRMRRMRKEMGMIIMSRKMREMGIWMRKDDE